MIQELCAPIDKFIMTSCKDFKVVDKVIYEPNKAEYVLTIKDIMISISILSDLTYDIFAIQIENENLILSVTKYFHEINEVLSQLKKDLLTLV